MPTAAAPRPDMDAEHPRLSADLVFSIRRSVEQEYGPHVGKLLTEALDEAQRTQSLVSCVQASTAMVGNMTSTFSPILAQANGALQTLADAELLNAQTEARRQVMWSKALGKEGVLTAIVTALIALGGVYLTGNYAEPAPVLEVAAEVLPGPRPPSSERD